MPLLVVGTMSPAAAAKKKPPKITDVTASTRLVDQGAPFHFTVSAKNSSTKRSVPVGLLFVLSESTDYDDGVVLGSGALPALARKARFSAPFSVTIPSAQPDDDYRLLVCVPRAGKSPECREDVAVDVEEVAAQPSGSPSGGSTVPPGSSSTLPSRILNLANWKLTLPVDSKGLTSGTAIEVIQPQLASYRHPAWFTANLEGTAVVFRANAGGATTSGSNYARSELREMAGSSRAAWSRATGDHTMIIRQAITRVPVNKSEVVAGQIHDGSDDVLQIRYEEDEGLIALLANGSVRRTIDAGYRLGTTFTVVVHVNSAGIDVTYNGTAKVTDFQPSGAGDGWYFKAGCYTQSNEEHDDDAEYGEVVVSGLTLAHS